MKKKDSHMWYGGASFRMRNCLSIVANRIQKAHWLKKVVALTAAATMMVTPLTVTAIGSDSDSGDLNPVIGLGSSTMEQHGDPALQQENGVGNVEAGAQYFLSVVADEGGTVKDVSGWYAEGTEIDIEAEPDYLGGYEFDRWVSSSKTTPKVSTHPSTTFTMADHDVELTATFYATGQEWSHVTLDAGEGGTADGNTGWVLRGDANYLNKAFYWLEATPAEGYLFDCWETDGEVIFSDRFSSRSNYIVVEPDATVTAQFKRREDNGKHHLLVEAYYTNSFYRSQYIHSEYVEAGEIVTVDVSSAARRTFVFGGLSGYVEMPHELELEVDYDAMTATFIMPDCDVNVEALFTDRMGRYIAILAGVGGEISQGETGLYEWNHVIDLEATAHEGYEFVQWTAVDDWGGYGDPGVLVDPLSNTTQYIVPECDVTVTAVFQQLETGCTCEDPYCCEDDCTCGSECDCGGGTNDGCQCEDPDCCDDDCSCDTGCNCGGDEGGDGNGGNGDEDGYGGNEGSDDNDGNSGDGSDGDDKGDGGDTGGGTTPNNNGGGRSKGTRKPKADTPGVDVLGLWGVWPIESIEDVADDDAIPEESAMEVPENSVAQEDTHNPDTGRAPLRGLPFVAVMGFLLSAFLFRLASPRTGKLDD